MFPLKLKQQYNYGKEKVNITNSNSYTFIFAIILVVVVGSVLAFAATTLQPLQNENVRKEKMQNILATVGVETDRDGAEALYNNYVKEAYVLDQNGDVIESEDAFAIDLKKELRKSVEKQFFPIYIAEIEGENYYIVPLQGKGLWDDIWGYIALKNDVNTIQGAVFDHKGETLVLVLKLLRVGFRNVLPMRKYLIPTVILLV